MASISSNSLNSYYASKAPKISSKTIAKTQANSQKGLVSNSLKLSDGRSINTSGMINDAKGNALGHPVWDKDGKEIKGVYAQIDAKTGKVTVTESNADGTSKVMYHYDKDGNFTHKTAISTTEESKSPKGLVSNDFQLQDGRSIGTGEARRSADGSTYTPVYDKDGKEIKGASAKYDAKTGNYTITDAKGNTETFDKNGKSIGKTMGTSTSSSKIAVKTSLSPNTKKTLSKLAALALFAAPKIAKTVKTAASKSTTASKTQKK